MRIVFLGSPEFAVPALRALHASQHEVVAVVTQPDRPFGRHLQMHAPPVKVAAQDLKIPVLQPVTTRTPEFVDAVSSYRPEILAVVAYGEILRPALLGVAPGGAVNLHASLLPKYRGAAPVAWAIWNGEKQTGCSTMFITEKMDAGPVYLQESCEILDTDTTESLLKKLGDRGAPLLKLTLDRIAQEGLQPRPQEESLVTFAPKLKKEDGAIPWDQTAHRIWLQTRAFHPWPGSFTSFRGHRIKIHNVIPSPEITDLPPGTVMKIEKDAIHVAAGNGTTLLLRELQPENRSRLSPRDFANGMRVHPGDLFAPIPIS